MSSTSAATSSCASEQYLLDGKVNPTYPIVLGLDSYGPGQQSFQADGFFGSYGIFNLFGPFHHHVLNVTGGGACSGPKPVKKATLNASYSIAIQ